MPETYIFPMDTEPLTLQSIVCGWYADERFMGSWKVCLNGSKIFHGDIKRWLHIYSGTNWTEEILEKIKNLNDFLNRTSQGEFKNKFKEYNLHCKENQEPTGNWQKGDKAFCRCVVCLCPCVFTCPWPHVSIYVSLCAYICVCSILHESFFGLSHSFHPSFPSLSSPISLTTFPLVTVLVSFLSLSILLLPVFTV